MNMPTPKIYRTTNWSSYNRGNFKIWFETGPLITSIRSIAEIGGIKLLFDSPKPFGVISPVLF